MLENGPKERGVPLDLPHQESFRRLQSPVPTFDFTLFFWEVSRKGLDLDRERDRDSGEKKDRRLSLEFVGIGWIGNCVLCPRFYVLSSDMEE